MPEALLCLNFLRFCSKLYGTGGKLPAISKERKWEMIKSFYFKYKEMILYVFFGGLTTLVNWGMYWLLNDVFHIHYLWATAIAYISSVLFSYVTNRIWVFESKVSGVRGIAVEMAKFFASRGATFLLDLFCMYVGVDLLHINDKLMKLLSNVIVIIVNYILSKLFIFRRKEQ